MADRKQRWIGICCEGRSFVAPCRGDERYSAEKAFLNKLTALENAVPKPGSDASRDAYVLTTAQVEAYFEFRKELRKADIAAGIIPDLSETAQRVLSEAEEADVDDVTCFMNTVFEPTGDDREIDDMRAALKELVRADLIRVGYEMTRIERLRALTKDRYKELSKDESLTAIELVGAYLAFNPSSSYWAWNETQRNIEIMLTETGSAEAVEILDERGYRWWRQENS